MKEKVRKNKEKKNKAMKAKLFYLVAAWLLSVGHALADNFVIQNVTVPQGGSADLVIGFNFTSESTKIGFTFGLGLPAGLTLAKDSEGDLLYVKNSSIDKLNIVSAGEGNIAGQPSSETSSIKGTGGTLLTLTLCADASLEAGTVITVPVRQATFQQKVEGSVSDINIPDFSFEVTIGEPADGRVRLDENSTVMPEAAEGVDVKVIRTIKANQWSTLCLPFDMTAEQVTAAFGEGVQLADFNGYEIVEDGDDIVGVTVKFNSISAVEANHPCLIKVTEQVKEFTADNVTIDPEEEPTVAAVKRTRKQWSELIGTYVAQTEVPEKTLFLSDNKFWYSTGATTMKAFRAYFDFYDVLTEVDEAFSRFALVFEEETTGIKSIDNGQLTIDNGAVYDLQGRRVKNPKRGLYILSGKKVVIK